MPSRTAITRSLPTYCKLPYATTTLLTLQHLTPRTPSVSHPYLVSLPFRRMWLNRYTGQSSPASSASPFPQRRPSHLAPNSTPQRPPLSPHASSLSLLLNGSTDSLPHEARLLNGSGLKYQIDASPTEAVSDPLDVLGDVLGPPHALSHVVGENTDTSTEEIDFEGMTLQNFALSASSVTPGHAHIDKPSSPSFEECTSGHSILLTSPPA